MRINRRSDHFIKMLFGAIFIPSTFHQATAVNIICVTLHNFECRGNLLILLEF